MADISAEIAAFQSAVYGEEVRGSMISAIEKINDVAEDAEDTVGEFSNGFQNAVNSCSDAADAANAAASSANAAAATADTATEAATNAASSATSAASNATAQANAASQLNTTVQQAEAARRTAESARVTAENSRVAAETARAGSESNRSNAEATRQENETNRNTAEVARVSAEATRQANESSRQTAETLRAGAEQSRASAFSAMQQSFSEMEQQVLPPATYSTLGGVIVDANSGLEVASDGTLSFEAGDFETSTHAAATYATIETVNGKANAQHNHSATDINNGTLAVVRGGTGVTTAAAERERLGLGSTTDALPVANGGTGATTATGALANLGAYSSTEVDAALADYLPLTGGNISDSINADHNFVIKVTDQDRDGAAPSADQFSSDSANAAFRFRDKDGELISQYRVIRRANESIEWNILACNENSSGTGNIYGGGLAGGVKHDGTSYYLFTDNAAFRNGLGASSGIWPVSLGGTGQSGVTEVTTASQIITMKSGYTIDSVAFVQWGRIGQFHIRWKASSDLAIPAHGNIANFIIGTIVSGKRPKINTAWHSHGDDAGQAWGYADINGNLTASAFEGTGVARTITAGTVITSDFVCILA